MRIGERLNGVGQDREMAAVRSGLSTQAKAGSRSKAKSETQTKTKTKTKATSRNARSTQAKGVNGTSKQRGELAEMMFMVKATQKGFATAKPYGDSRPYDFILDAGNRLWRVQVKSTSALQYGSYMVNLQRNANGKVVFYEATEIDFVVANVMPCDAWFVIPVEAVYGRQTAKLCLKGDAGSGVLGKYWEAWGLMRSVTSGAGRWW